MDSRPGLEESYKIGSVRPSFRLFVSFLEIGSLVFSETYGVRGPYIIVCDSRIFRKKSRSGKNEQEWSKMAQKQEFWTFQENHVISFVWNLCKMKVLMVH